MVIWNLNFSYSVALKSIICLALRTNLSPMHDFLTSYIGYLENWFTELVIRIFQMLTHFTTLYKQKSCIH